MPAARIINYPGAEYRLVSVWIFTILVTTEATAVFSLQIVLHVHNAAVQHVAT